jgi:uncharacterized protein YbjQ (UPF0145 family)
MMRILLVLLFTLVPACGEAPCCVSTEAVLIASPPPPPPVAIVQQPPPSSASEVSAMALVAPQVLILQSTHTDRLTEVVGVVDVHEEMGHHDAALAALRSRAAALGADAVLGVEFHHGHGDDEPTHLSGLAVRFIREVR